MAFYALYATDTATATLQTASGARCSEQTSNGTRCVLAVWTDEAAHRAGTLGTRHGCRMLWCGPTLPEEEPPTVVASRALVDAERSR